MKKLFFSFIALALAASVQAQTWSATTIASGYPTVIAANSTTTLASSVTFDVRKQKDVNIMLQSAQAATGSNGVVTFTFARSVDNVNFETLAAKRTSVAIASVGTNITTTMTNINTYGAGWLKLVYIGNDDSAAVTNLVIKYGIKIGAP